MKKPALLLVVTAFYTFVLLPLAPVLWAQEAEDGLPLDLDIIAPLIEHQFPMEAAPANTPLPVKAKITDDSGVKRATLFYRRQSDKKDGSYTGIAMQLTEQNLYIGIIPGEAVVEPGLEYYIQATDEAGNTVYQYGPSSLPLTVMVDSKMAPIPPLLTTGKADTEKRWYQKWWVWTIVGAVAVGAAASGGGGGGGEPEPQSTSSVTISGPIP